MATEKAIGSKQKMISSLIIITKPASNDLTRPHLLYLWVTLQTLSHHRIGDKNAGSMLLLAFQGFELVTRPQMTGLC
jgi:hypothetical protein